MKALIMTWGSRGDFQPYLALARRMTTEGHEVRLAAPPNPAFTQLAADQGVPFVPLGPAIDPEDVMATHNEAAGARDTASIIQLIIHRLLLPNLDEMYRSALDSAHWADVVVSHLVQPAGRMAAETAGKPFVAAMLDPSGLPSRHRPPDGLPNLGTLANRLVWKLGVAYVNGLWSKGIDEARERAGLRPLGNLAGDGFFSRRLNFIAVSPLVMAPARDWAPRFQMTGFWHLPEQEWTPPQELEQFFKSGPKPIAVTFGSMLAADREAITGKILRAIRRSGVRAFIEPGSANLSAEPSHDTICMPEVPHAWLFPRVSAVVHHAGAGTMAAALRAGVPSVCVPHFLDQAFWSRAAKRLGVAPAPIKRKDLTSKRLAAAIAQATSDYAMIRCADELGAALHREDGTGTAARLLEQHMEARHTVLAPISREMPSVLKGSAA
jgi:sterol 3beta-glucosyltransferase